MDQFEEMRRQMASMKQRLDTQKIVNHELMCRVMRARASWMNIFVKAELVILPLVYLLIVAICHAYGISQWFSLAFLVFAGIDAILDTRTVSIPNSLFGSSSIVGLKRFLVRQKKERFIQTCISGALCTVWMTMFICAIASTVTTLTPGDSMWDAALTGGLIGAIVGAVVGIIVVVVLYCKMQRTNDRILADIARLENEE